ncbi:hypothetical protein [Galactobacter valiniphilus]|uniref:hypothetical protein n=1 Tax=Galactobacter valiniphilus TaxID=2676122 RepID=UPI0011C40DA4|nr:hypothetical protein [Galactobacter valiniphilus]
MEIVNFIKAMSPSGASAYDTGWVALTLNSGWTQGGSTQVAVRRIGKDVRVRGHVVHTTATGWTSPFTLPAGFRPPAGDTYPQNTSNATLGLSMQAAPDGVVTLWASAATNAWRPLRGLRFEVD